MDFTTTTGFKIAYDDRAPADYERAILLVHGFASNRDEGWKRTGWYAALERRRFRVVALDQRGHGESGKSHDPADYSRAALAADVVELIDHLAINRVDLFGYSMGARTAAAAALAAPHRFSNLILGGVGDKLLTERSGDRAEIMVQAMLAEDPESITEPFLKSFRQFADEQGEDRQALAAFVQAANPPLDVSGFAALPMPVLAVAGARETNGDPIELAKSFPLGQGVVIPGCDHFSAIPHALTKAAVFDFIDGVLDDPWPG
ncbi:alpha/beta fold hydrolase [Phenylobacterium sp.]|uniref:alpha/beta fold hydrolase n=1 Tax=Phenylobacterium sp. TaxID=1871053 RepID=UPI002869FB6E|nr:alpha/beta fold hydrolase [Phenylobacterium sp.]